MTKREIKKYANSFCDRNPFSAAAKKGITVLFSDLPDSTKGVCYTAFGKRIVLINSRLDETEARYVCAHELGHAVLHPELNYSFLITKTLFLPSKFEREADIFAAELLIDDSTLRQVEFERMSAAQVAAVLNLPEKLIQLKTE